MIDYVEIRNKNRKMIGVIDTAQSVIWHSLYFGVGDFEIYTKATQSALELLKEDFYITVPGDNEVGIIESIALNDDAQNGRMITASGHFAKRLLYRRHIYNLSNDNYSNIATVLSGNVETAVRSLVRDNIINCTWNTRRNISYIQLGALENITQTIIDDNGDAAQKQVSYENLLDYTEEILKEYGLGSRMTLDEDTLNLLYVVYKGKDRTIDNTDGNSPIIFSKEFDNLTSENYSYNKSNYKNMTLIGGAGEGIDRFYTVTNDYATGDQRYELFVDARNISKTYEDESTGESKTYTNAEYAQILKSTGKQKVAEYEAIEEMTGEIDTLLSPYKYGTDFGLGDLVTVESVDLKKYISVRITGITKVQDENGYTEAVEYES